MTVLWRTAGAWGSGLGRNLNPEEVDGNFWDHEQRIAVLEAAGAGVGIDYFEISGSELTVHMTDHTTRGPYAFPSNSFNFRGPFAGTTSYFENDLFSINGGLILVLVDHVSDVSFDVGATDGSGHNLYAEVFTQPGNSLPEAGTIGQVLAKASGDDFDVEWVTMLLENLGDVALGSPLNDGDKLAWSVALSKFTNVPGSLDVPGPATLGGVFSYTSPASEWITEIGTDGQPASSQPNFTDVAGSATAGQVPNIEDLNGQVADSQLVQVTVQEVASVSNVLTINRSAGEIVVISVTENITSIVVNNWPAADLLGRILLEFHQTGSFTVAGYPVDVWSAGSGEPTLTTGAGAIDRVLMSTIDHAATVLGDVVGQGYA